MAGLRLADFFRHYNPPVNLSAALAIAAFAVVAVAIAYGFLHRRSSLPIAPDAIAPDDPWGIFSPAMSAGKFAYLKLLNTVYPWKSIVERMSQCIYETADPFPDIYRLLDDADWRANIVGAVGLLLAPTDQGALQRLWKCIDEGTWASPQLAVAAALRDPDFAEKARARLINRCPIRPGRLYKAEELELSPGDAPDDDLRYNAKLAGALVRICELRFGPTSWLADIKRSPEIATFIANETGDGAQIAEAWLNDIITVVAQPQPRQG